MIDLDALLREVNESIVGGLDDEIIQVRQGLLRNVCQQLYRLKRMDKDILELIRQEQ